MAITKLQQDALKDISNSITSTHFGEAWPREYDEFFRMWGFFNRIYDTLYSDNAEWKKIAQFALDSRVNHVWVQIEPINEMKILASQPCVGNGKNGYQPTDEIRIAFHTLRSIYKIDVNDVCQMPKCEKRKKLGWATCDSFAWPAPPAKIHGVKNAIYTPLGAALAVIYQIRNNLFHGSKQEIAGAEYERNLTLISSSKEIIRIILGETNKIIVTIR